MNKIKKLIEKLSPDGVEMRELGEVTKYEQPTKYLVKSTDYNDKYETPVLTAGKTFILGYTDEKDGIYKASKAPLIIFDDFTTSRKWVDFDCKVKSSAMKFITSSDIEKYSLRYIYHFMTTIPMKNNFEHKRQWISSFSKIQIPIPPIQVQEEIVKILDKLTYTTEELQKNLKIEKELYEKQYVYYCDKLLNFEGREDVEFKELGEVCKVTKLAGYEFTKYVKYSDKGDVIALRGLNVKKGNLKLDNLKYMDESDFTKLERSKLYRGDILFTYIGTVGEVAIIDENDKYYLGPNVSLIRVDKKILMPRFLLHFFLSDKFKYKQVEKLMQLSSMKNLTMEKIRLFKIPIPSLSEQQKIVEKLDKLTTATNKITEDIETEIDLRQKQHEYYREKLLSFNTKI